MAKTLSTMLPLGTLLPRFSLPDTEGRLQSFDAFPKAQAYLVMFICNHCPYVVHVRDGMIKLAQDLQKQGVAVLAINSNDISVYPEDSPAQMKIYSEKYHYPFPYLFDEDQSVAKAFKAACTPDFFLFDATKHLVYRGQMDDSRPGKDIPVDGADILKAVADMFAGKKPSENTQKPSMGCNIKWKPNNEPKY